VSEAEELDKMARDKGLLFAVTYSYTGYPAVKEIRSLIKKGEIGAIRFINAEYSQEWLYNDAEHQGNKQAAWRVDPAQAGKSCCVGDIGSHAENMVYYMTGKKIKKLLARLDTFVPGRKLDDNASIMVEYENGGKGLYWASDIAIGYDNALSVRIFGSKATIEWKQEEGNYFTLIKPGAPRERWSRGREAFDAHAQSYSRVPAGHPEGYFEALGNLYKTYIEALSKKKAGGTLTEDDRDFPGADMGADGVRFIAKCVESSQKGSVWVDM
jgi:predicted dehydrogenase